ncbi:S8 family serine peptidase [bacterium]|nr:S8 family serine peptidase [bacterium]
MRRMRSNLVLLIAMVLCAGAATAEPVQTELDYIDGVLVVRFLDDVTPVVAKTGHLTVGMPEIDRLFDRFEAYDYGHLAGPLNIQDEDYRHLIRNDYFLYFPEDADIPLIAEELLASGRFEFALPDYLIPMDYIPDDPRITSQWFHGVMQNFDAWDHLNGENVVIGVIDSGFDFNHPDLWENVWVNPDEDIDGDPSPFNPMFPELPGTFGDENEVDDDGNGYVDDFIGWDWVSGANAAPGEDGSNPDNNPMDFGGHGTGVGAAAAEVGDNGDGAVGVAYGAKILPLRCGYEDPSGQGLVQSSAGLQAMQYSAVMADLHDLKLIVNMSYGSNNSWTPMANAIDAAFNAGVLPVGAAGNDNSPQLHYPAAYNHVMSVAATTSQDQRASFSNYGTWVDVAAPGQGCHTAWFDDSYTTWDGTSVASPIAAGVAALVASRWPNAGPAVWEEKVLESAEDIGSSQPIGSGRVNSYRAITQSYWPDLTFEEIEVIEEIPNNRGDAGETVQIVVTVTNAPEFMEALFATATLSFDIEGLNLVNDEVTFTSIAPGETVNNSSDPFEVEIPDDWEGGIFTDMTITIESEPNSYVVATTERVLIGTPDILYVHDTWNELLPQYILSDLEEFGGVYHMWDTFEDGELTQTEIDQYNLVIWQCGPATDPLTTGEVTMIQNAMDNGINFFISGENIDEQQAGTSFYSDYLHAASAGTVGNQALDAVNGSGGPVIDDSRLVLTGAGGSGNSTDPDGITPQGSAVGGYHYLNAPDSYGMLYYAGDYNLVYFSCNFEAISGAAGTTSRADFVTNMMNWLDISDVEESTEPAVLPDEFAIRAAYPNPFNPSTTLDIALPQQSHVTLRVFDVLGREVAALADNTYGAGVHSFQWNAHGRAAGMYFAVMQTRGQTHTAKLLLVK